MEQLCLALPVQPGKNAGADVRIQQAFSVPGEGGVGGVGGYHLRVRGSRLHVGVSAGHSRWATAP